MTEVTVVIGHCPCQESWGSSPRLLFGAHWARRRQVFLLARLGQYGNTQDRAGI